MINSKDYMLVQGWMVSELHLKGLEKEVYAIIYGFTRSKQGKFTGSLQYLCDWTLASKQGVTKALTSLVEGGLITKSEVYYNNVKFVEYYTTEVCNSVDHYTTEFNGGMQLSCTNNTNINNNKENNIESKDSNYYIKEKFVKPTLKEVQEYVLKMNYHFSPELFISHYETVGWKYGKNDMKSWQSACKTWELRWKNEHPEENNDDNDCPYTIGVKL